MPLSTSSRNRWVALSVILLVCAMLGLAFASVPLYRLFCQITGYGGTPLRAEAKLQDALQGQRHLTVRFDTNVGSGLPFKFEAERPEITVRTGETVTVFFRAENLSEKPITAHAVFNVTPDQMGAFFNKLACFCFTDQRLDAHERVEFPVVFFLDPALETEESTRHISSLTLSYTFFASPASTP